MHWSIHFDEPEAFSVIDTGISYPGYVKFSKQERVCHTILKMCVLMWRGWVERWGWTSPALSFPSSLVMYHLINILLHYFTKGVVTLTIYIGRFTWFNCRLFFQIFFSSKCNVIWWCSVDKLPFLRTVLEFLNDSSIYSCTWHHGWFRNTYLSMDLFGFLSSWHITCTMGCDCKIQPETHNKALHSVKVTRGSETWVCPDLEKEQEYVTW